MTRIAVVEDNPDNRLLVLALLDGLHDCVEYESGLEALDAFDREVPDLVLLDISLPGLDGVDTLKRIRGNPLLVHLPVIALTAHAMSGDRERFIAEGFDDYVTKPIVDETILLGAIERGLALVRSRS
ncbi:MAG: response regulator [Cytophagaceae bacterium]|nr:response regulator [Gemmatimonadaceae bacterium]